MTAETVAPPPAPRGSRPVASTASPLPTVAGPSLSPSRAADFKTCPLLFRFRTIDRLPEQPTRDQVRGTLIHAVLERLFDLPAADRTPEAAAALVAPEWERLVTAEPTLSALFTTPEPTSAPDPATTALPAPATDPAAPPATAPDPATAALTAGASPTPLPSVAPPLPLPDMPEESDLSELAGFLASAGSLLDGYFAVEDPTRLEPAERESLVSTLIDDELLIRGYIDRLDISPAGDLRVVDYKTGGAPREAFEGRALFQLKFYALVLWRTRGVVPRVLRLLYLKDAEALDYSPDAEELQRFERTLVALSQAVEKAKQDRDFRPKKSRLCGWCHHQARCPEFGGTPPPYPTLVPTPTVPDLEDDTLPTTRHTPAPR